MPMARLIASVASEAESAPNTPKWRTSTPDSSNRLTSSQRPVLTVLTLMVLPPLSEAMLYGFQIYITVGLSPTAL